MSLTLAHLQPGEVTLDDLRTVIDLWADQSPERERTSRSRSGSSGSGPPRRATWNVTPATRSPRVPNHAPDLLPHVDTQLLAVAQNERDLLALTLLLDLGIRKAELRGIMVRDSTSPRRHMTVFGKGPKERVPPLRGRVGSSRRRLPCSRRT